MAVNVANGTPTSTAASRAQEAAALLEQAAKVSKTTPESQYLLAMCYKRQGQPGQARATLRKITPADVNVHLQLGLLSFHEGEFVQAEQEFDQALDLEPHFYPAMYNLLLCRIFRGQLHQCSNELLPKLINLAESMEEKRFLAQLDALICTADLTPDGPIPVRVDSGMPHFSTSNSSQLLGSMTADEEQALLRLIQGVPHFEAVYPLLNRLAQARPQSAHVQQAWLEIVLVQAKHHIDRYAWKEADDLLMPLGRAIDASPETANAVPPGVIVAFWNLQGCCACMLQDFNRAARCFSAALKWSNDDPLLYQNLAIACELLGRLDQAEIHWNRYFDLLNHRVPTPPIPNYLEELAFAGLNRLAEYHTKLERWNSVLGYLRRAHHLRPRDLETLEKLFNTYVQIRRTEDARRTLGRLRELKPNDPQYDLYELDLREVRSLEDLDQMLADIKRILHLHPGDMRVEDRALGMVVNCVPLIGKKCDQLSEQLSHIVEQVRRLPNYQINWPVVHDEMHFLRHEFQKLRRLTNKCMNLVTAEEQRRVIRDLNSHIDSKIDICISMGG